MQRFLRHCLLALPLACLNPGTLLATQSNAGPWKVGERAPHLHLPTLGNSAQDGTRAAGASLDLSDFLGRRVLLIEFASW